MDNKVKDVREHLLRDKMVEELTTLESEGPTRRNASVKVIISNSRMTVRTPQRSIALISSLPHSMYIIPGVVFL